MRMTTARRAVTDRTLNRLIVALAALLIIGLPAIAVLYFMDRNVDPGPSMTQRTIDAAEAAVRLDPNKLSTRLGLAAAYVDAGRQQDAIAQFSQVLSADAGNSVALLGRADAYVALQQLDAAKRDYQALVDATKGEETAGADPKLEAAYYGLGSIALQQNRPRDAATFLADAITINRTDADALNLMGTALIRIGDTKNAVAALRDAIALVPTGWCDPYTNLQQAYAALRDEAGTQYAKGMIALCQNRAADATALLQPLVGGPLNRDALIGLGEAAEAQNDTAAATSYYSRVYEADPKDFAAITGLNRLGASAPSVAPSASPSADASEGAPSPSGGN